MSAALKCFLTPLFALYIAAAQGQQTETIAPTLKVGDSAPALTVGKWLRGTPQDTFHSSETYLIVFWSTWCANFVPIAPHLSDLQREYQGQAEVIAVSVFESSQQRVPAYVTKMGDKMSFAVAMDKVPSDVRHGLDGAMARSWLAASQQTGVPIAFIVDRDGKIAWIGSPVGDLADEPLRKIVNGTWDRAAYAKAYASEQDKAAATNRLEQEMEAAIQASNWDAALKAGDELAPYDKSASVASRYLILLLKGSFSDAYAYAHQLVDGPFHDDANTLYALAWITVNPASHWKETDYQLGIDSAKRSVELTGEKDPAKLDVLAWAYFQKKDAQNAIATEKQAIAIANDVQKPVLARNLKTFSG